MCGSLLFWWFLLLLIFWVLSWGCSLLFCHWSAWKSLGFYAAAFQIQYLYIILTTHLCGYLLKSLKLTYIQNPQKKSKQKQVLVESINHQFWNIYNSMENQTFLQQEKEQLFSNHTSLIYKLLRNQTEKVIHAHESRVQNEGEQLGENYHQFYSEFFKELEMTHATTINNHFAELSASPRKLIHQLIDMFRIAFGYVHKIIAKKCSNKLRENGFPSHEMERIEYFGSGCTLCRKCSAVVIGKQIEYQKINIEYSQFQDPYNLFAIGMTEFQETGSQKYINNYHYNSDQNELHKVKIESHIESIKKRVFKRANEITQILNDFEKYYLDITTQQNEVKRNNNNEERIIVKTFDGCLREILDILTEKMEGLIDQFRIVREKKMRNFTEQQIQVDSISQQLSRYFQQISKLTKQLDDKKNQILTIIDQKVQLSLKLNELKREIEKQTKKTNEYFIENQTIIQEKKKGESQHQEIIRRLSQKEKQNEELTLKIQNLLNEVGRKKKIKNGGKEKKVGEAKKKKNRLSGRTVRIEQRSSSELDAVIDENEEQEENGIWQIQDEKDEFFDYVDSQIIANDNDNPSRMKKTRNKYKKLKSINMRSSSISLSDRDSRDISDQKNQYLQKQKTESGNMDKIKENTNNKQIKLIKKEAASNHKIRRLQSRKTTKIQISNETINEKAQRQQEQQNTKQNIQILPSLKKEQQSKHQQSEKKIQKKPKPRISRNSSKNRPENSNALSLIRNERFSADVKPQESLSVLQSIKNRKRDMTQRQSSLTKNKDAIAELTKKLNNKTYFSGFNQTFKENKFGRNKMFHKTLESILMERVKNEDRLNYTLNEQYGRTMNFDLLAKKYQQDVFSIEDIENMYFSVEGALQHEKERKRNFKEVEQSIPRMKISMKLLTMLASMHSINQQVYQLIKNFLVTPFQSIVSQQNYITISKSGINQIKLKQALNKILWLHRMCPGQICDHLRKFIDKIEKLTKITK